MSVSESENHTGVFLEKRLMKLNVRHVPHWTAAVAAFLAATAQAAAAQQLPEGVTEVASVEGITEYRLDNGLRVSPVP